MATFEELSLQFELEQTRVSFFLNQCKSGMEDCTNAIIHKRSDEIDQYRTKLDSAFGNLFVCKGHLKLTESNQVEFAAISGKYEALLSSCMEVQKELLSNIQPERPRSESQVPKEEPIKLPKIDVPIFKGNVNSPMDFYHFSTKFSDLLTCHPGLTPNQKIIILRSKLQGAPLALISSFSDFDTAWNLLEKEFLNQRKVVEAIMDQILNSGDLTNVRQLKEYFVLLKFKIAEMHSLGYSSTDHLFSNTLMGKLVRDKLPTFFKQEIARRTGTECSTLSQILEHADNVCGLFLPTSHISKSFASKTKQSISQPNLTQDKKVNSGSENFNAVASGSSKVFATHTTANNNITKKCKFCNEESHSSFKCSNYTSVKSRKDRAKELGLCSRCLVSGHDLSSCSKTTFPFNCSICGKNNHISPFCFQNSLNLNSKSIPTKPSEQKLSTSSKSTSNPQL